jgi:predicted acylesterase/phospholipase RssA
VFGAGCVHKATPRLAAYDLDLGYRFEKLAKDSMPDQPMNSDQLFVVLAFSGGGTRAAALSSGVLKELAHVKFHFNPTTGLPERCEPVDTPRCKAMERSLLDEVDVISSVSGGSFTSAYFALHGNEMFDPKSAFQRDFLYSSLQRDLFSQAVYYPKNWLHLGARTEIAADLYDARIFKNATFGDLERRPRPYVILNATDASTGARFEFNQEQFDLLCADLSQVPVARGVTASSAFPGLLNSMAIDSHNDTQGCRYTGPGSKVGNDWVQLALQDRAINARRYRAALDVLAYRDPSRAYFHLLDGGLADNIGLRSVIQSLTTTDRPVQPHPGAPPTLGGWSLLSMVNNRKIKTLVVITVNAHTASDSSWDQHAAGPTTIGVLGATNGIPMGNFSVDTLELLQSTLQEYVEPEALAGLKTLALEVAFDNLPGPEQHFFNNMATSFELQPFEVDCLVDRGGKLLADATSVNQVPTRTFSSFVKDDLMGWFEPIPGPHPAVCTDEAAKRLNGIRPHYIDIGLEYSVSIPGSGDVEKDKGLGLALRITRPNGLSAIVDFGTQSFDVPGSIGGGTVRLGQLGLRALLGGVAYTHRVGQLEATGGVAGGYGFGHFDLSDAARDAYGRLGTFGLTGDATNAWIVSPRIGLWQSLNDRWAATVSASYALSRPTVRLTSGSIVEQRSIDASALRIAAGIAYKVF